VPATRAITDQFTWDAERLRYRRNGRFVSDRAVKLAVRRVIRNSANEMRVLADQVGRGEITIQEFQSRFASELKNLHVSGAAAGQGGLNTMARNDYLRVGRGLKEQYRYLERFAQQIKAGNLTAQQVRTRAEMYVNSMNAAHESGRRDSAIGAGFDEEKNLLGVREHHCTTKDRPGCRELTARGFVPIGTLTAVGQRQCLSWCGCSLKFRKRSRA
jgi:hypothetical protein